MASARVEQTLERFQEDERLTSDLTDDTATALLGWIEQQVQAADALPEQHAFEQQVAAIRSAARTAASSRAADPTPAAVVEQAQAALQTRTSAPPPTPEPVPAASVEAPAAPASVSAEPSSTPPAPITSLWRTLRRRVRRWTHRKAS